MKMNVKISEINMFATLVAINALADNTCQDNISQKITLGIIKKLAKSAIKYAKEEKSGDKE